MKRITGILAAAALGAMALAPLPGIAQTAMNHGAMPMADTAAMSDGEVRKVDKEAGKLTIKHGPIKNLDMPPMTMVFTVKDKALLDTVKVGDKVRFHAVDEGGKLVVTAIQPVK